MSNSFYNFTNTLVSALTARSADLNTEFINITAAFAAVDLLVGLAVEYTNGNSGASKTVNPANGRFQNITLNSATPAITVSAATVVGTYQLKIIQDASGSRAPTWVGFDDLHCVGNSFPTIASAANGVTIMYLYWDGTHFWVSTTNWD